MHVHKYPSIPNVFEKMKIPNTGTRYRHGAWTSPELASLHNTTWHGTEKIDGTNIRIGWDGTTATFHGREHKQGNLPPDHTGIPQLLKTTFSTAALAAAYPGKPLTFYVEAFGPGIARLGRLYGTQPQLRLLDVYINDIWLEPHNLRNVAETLNLGTAPRVFTGTLYEAAAAVANGQESIFGPFPAEGLIVTTADNLCNRRGERISCKVKYEYFNGDAAWRPHLKANRT